MNVEPVETRTVGPLIVKVLPDHGGDQECPLDGWDNDIKFVTFERRSTLSNYHDFDKPDDVEKWAKKNRYEVFPLFKYEHGLVSYSTSSFRGRAHHAEWDSGPVGFVLIKKSAYRKPAKRAEIAESICQSVTKWCNGEYYGYTIEQDDEIIESCWGFEDSDYCLSEAMNLAKFLTKEPKMCDECGVNRADPPSKLCPGCQAYKEHTQ